MAMAPATTAAPPAAVAAAAAAMRALLERSEGALFSGSSPAACGLLEALLGAAPLLRERDGCVPYYAAVCSDNAAWTWQRVDVLPDGDRVLMRSEILDPSLPFATMLILLGHS